MPACASISSQPVVLPPGQYIPFLSVKVSDSIVERYKQAHRTGLLSDVVQEGAAVFGALLLRCPLPVTKHGCIRSKGEGSIVGGHAVVTKTEPVVLM